MQAVDEVRGVISCTAACAALSVPRPTYYRARARALRPTPASGVETRPRKASPRALSSEERTQALELLHSPRFCDHAVRQVWSTLMDEDQYICSPSTMYRLLRERGETRERRDQLVRPAYKKPELLASGPNQVWSWDITKLKGPVKWTYFYLYVLLDIFSRYAVGWMVARCENALLAKKLIGETLAKYEIEPGSLVIHSDRGPPMISKNLALLYADLGVTQSLSRPYVSDDNPFSEAQFKTLKYRPEFPERFGCLEDARSFSTSLFDWYHHQHRHSGIGWMTPADVHFGRAPEIISRRARVLDLAYQLNPQRFVRRPPTPPALPATVWINPPATNYAVAAQ